MNLESLIYLQNQDCFIKNLITWNFAISNQFINQEYFSSKIFYSENFQQVQYQCIRLNRLLMTNPKIELNIHCSFLNHNYEVVHF